MLGPSFRSFALAISLLVAWTFIPKNAAFSAEPEATDSRSTPRPRPPQLPSGVQARQIPENPFRCDRMIRHLGRTLPCDSPLRKDGEGLRSILEANPDALAELESYQRGRNKIKYAAYGGTAGALITIFSGTIANLIVDKSRTQARTDVAKVLRFGGAGLTLGTIGYGISHLKSNEDHLNQAILKYNAAEPKRPIQILFQSEF